MVKSKRHFIFILFLLGFWSISFGQSYPGFVSGNYAGAAGIIHQPASIAENAYPWDVVLVGVNIFADNNYGKVIRNRAFMNFQFSGIESELIRDKETKYGVVNIEITGPSFMLRLKDSRAVGFVSRVRTFANADGLTGDLANAIADGFNNSSTFDQSFANQQYYLKLNSWQEYGITYAQTIRQTPYTKIKAGVTAKLLIGNGAANVDFITGSFQNIGDKLLLLPEFALKYGYSQEMGNIVDGGFSFFGGKKGFGMDLGITYEYFETSRGPTPSSNKIIGNYNKVTNTVPKYKYKVGLALLDIGRLNYAYGASSGKASVVLDGTDIVDLNLLQGTYDDPNALNNALTNMVNLSEVSGKYSMGLPTAMQANFDYRIRDKVYVNTNAYVNITFLKWADYSTHDLSNVTVTPRWENNWLGFYAPFYVNTKKQFNMGLGTRIGPLIVGVHDFLPFLVRKESTSIGAYLMLKTFIPNKKEKKSKLECGPDGWKRRKKKK